jgi:hypothetical protein
MLRKIIKDCLGSVALAESMDDEAEGYEDDNAVDDGEGHEYDDNDEDDEDDDEECEEAFSDDDDGDDGDDEFDYDDVSF